MMKYGMWRNDMNNVRENFREMTGMKYRQI